MATTWSEPLTSLHMPTVLQTLPERPSPLRVKAKPPNSPPGPRWSALSLSDITSHSLPSSLGSGHTGLFATSQHTPRCTPLCKLLLSPKSPGVHVTFSVRPPLPPFLNSTACPHPTLQSHSPYSRFFQYNLFMHLTVYPFIVIYCLTLSPLE